MEKHREKYNNNNNKDDQQSMRYGRTFLARNQENLPSNVGFSWPPRSYTCSFCKREFRSAQALGGHMNVHRRDRARLRQCSPPWDLPSSSTLKTSSKTTNVPNLNMPPPCLVTRDDEETCCYSFPSLITPHAFTISSNSSLFGVREWRNFMEEGGRKEEKEEVLKLSLDLDFDYGDFEGSLDLELRLGYNY